MDTKGNRYAMRGVSSAKEDVHNAIKNIDKGLWFTSGWSVESIRDPTNVTTEIV